MNIKELNQYRSICREIEEISIKLKNKNIHTSVIGSDSEFPYTQHTMSTDGVESTRENSVLLRRLTALTRRRETIESFVNEIDDSLTRRIFTLRYIDGNHRPTWNRIAIMLGGGNSSDGVKMLCWRYLKKVKK